MTRGRRIDLERLLREADEDERDRLAARLAEVEAERDEAVFQAQESDKESQKNDQAAARLTEAEAENERLRNSMTIDFLNELTIRARDAEAECVRLREQIAQLQRDMDWHRKHGWGEPE